MTLAETHARHWGGKSITDRNFKSVDWLNGENRETWEQCLKTVKRAWSKANKEGMSEKVVNIISKTLENAAFEKAIEEMKSRPLTLTHGDFHPKNLFLTHDS